MLEYGKLILEAENALHDFDLEEALRMDVDYKAAIDAATLLKNTCVFLPVPSFALNYIAALATDLQSRRDALQDAIEFYWKHQTECFQADYTSTLQEGFHEYHN